MKRIQTVCISLFIFIYTLSSVNAQYCTPTYSNPCTSDDFIDDFTFSNISNLNSGCNGDSNSYSYSALTGSVTKGNTYTINLQSGSYSQGFGVWIDYNQDGDFADTLEFVYTSPTPSTTLQTGSIKIPDSVLTGATRLRVRSRYNNTVNDSQYCSNFSYGETEDYKLFITSPTDPPIANFSSNVTQSCNGLINFSDLSTNNPNKWKWDFGDTKTDTVKNPTHTYTAPGTFDVQLIVSNSYGSDTIKKLAFIKIETPDTLPYNQNFEAGVTSINDFKVTINSQSDVQVIAAAANTSSFGLMMGGLSTTSWTDPNTGEEFTANPLHNASASLCIDATSLTSLVLLFDLKLQYQYQNNYTNFHVTANGVQVGATYQPNGATTSWSNQLIDLSTFAGNVIELVFQTSCKYSYDNGGVSTGNGAFIDNIQIMTVASPPIAGFTQNKKLTCDGLIQFTDQSGFGPTGWKWDFGDGKTDTVQNPSYNYLSDGIFSVQLIASNSYGSDTILKTNLITVTLGGYTCDTIRIPATGFGITQTNCNGIIADDGGGTADYSPNSEGIITITSSDTNVAYFTLTFFSFDFENNYDYLYIYDGKDTNATLIGKYSDITLPNGGVIQSTGASLTLRQTSDGGVENAGFLGEWKCYYKNQPPIAGFSADMTKTCSGQINFTDKSFPLATSWKWNFGDTQTDTVQNPTHNYLSDGIFSVQLIASNSYGSDTILKANLITVTLGDYTCDTIRIPATGFGITQTNCNGIIADDGSSALNYSPNSKGIITITSSDTNVAYFTLTFFSFDFENNYDYLYIYDGKDTNAALIGKYTGITLPNGGVIQSTGSSLTLRQTSDGGVEKAGFLGEWKCYYKNQPPVAGFSADMTKSCSGQINFTDKSFPLATSWKWNFGDTQTDTVQNPTHTYSASGTYSVTLIAANANGPDTLVKTNYIIVTTHDSLPYYQDFEKGIDTGTVKVLTNLQSAISVIPDAANASTLGLMMGGNAATAWTNPAAGEEFAINPDHFAKVSVCIDASNVSTLMLQFDLKLLYEYNDFYTNFRVTVNGTQVGTIFQPSGATSTWSTKLIDLSSFVGGVIELAFETNCKYTYNDGGIDIGNGVYIDNIKLSEMNFPPAADFSYNKNFKCDGIVQFTDLSIFSPISWLWNFGDGKTDTVQNPAHAYSVPGTYSVTLIAANTNGPDTLLKSNYIIVTTPDTLPYYQDFEKGIDTGTVKVLTNLQSAISVIPDAANASTLGLMMGGNAATAWTNPAAGEEFTTNPDHFAKVSVCVDASNVSTLMLQFDLKLLYEYDNFYTNFRVTVNGVQVGTIYQPSGATSTWSTKLIDLSSFVGGVIELAFETNCKYAYNAGGANIGNGVYIDNINLTEMNLPPMSDFTYDKSVTCDGIINFTDFSMLAPTTWLWNFDDGNTDTVKNPTHTYTKDGTYSVTLIATNTFGSDTIIKSNIISVKLGSFVCDSFKIPAMGTASSDKCNGMLLDDGGTSNYTSNSDGSFTIEPAGCVKNIKLIFSSFDFENNYDYLNIYDGPTNTSPLIGSYTSTTLPNGGIITSTSGSITLNQTSDGSADKAGFFLTWQCSTITPTIAPIASFATVDTFPCYGIAKFQDLSLECPESWLWNFGDGKTDSVSNPNHTYTSDGVYTVKLVVSNSFGSDTVIKTNYISIDFASTKCDTLKMPTSGDTTVTSCLGILTDNGGGGNDYTNNTNGVVTIAPSGCVGNVTLNFIFFSVDDGFSPDYLHIYDGPDTNSTLIGSFMGDSLPMGGTIISSGGAITLRQQTNGFTTMAGYIVNWSCYIETGPPVADFSVNTTIPCDGIVKFSDNSSSCPDSWLWDFGDGTTDTVENPVHAYAVQNKYTISLTVTNSYGTDSIAKINYINYDTIKPKAIVCKPQTKSTCCGVGIYNVNLSGVFNNTTANATEGYQEFSDCSGRGMVTEGTNYPISIQTNPSASEHVRVWIDFDNNAEFNDTTELVFSSDSVQFHTGTIFIPGTAVKDSLLRMRVSSEIGGLPAPGPCDSLELGQTEDYGLVVQKGTNPPLSDFKVSDTLVCTGTIKFTDKSLYSPTSWLWNFGDSKTSTQQNPTYTYTTDGLYTVTLKATNAFGNNTITKTNLINVTLSKYVKSPLCEPPTVANCCSYGIYNVTFEGINYSSGDGAEGYQDLTCTQNTEVMEGQEYNISIQTGPKYNQDTRVWIDFDNNGIFDENTELVFSADNLKNPSGIVFIPGGVVKGTAVRMRVSSDFSGSYPTSCSMMEFGQTEDYGITFKDNPNPPVARINFEGNNSCEGVVQFIDKSLNVPTSWLWDFGDGFTDTTQHPFHTYIFNGKYTVTLFVSNAYGKDTLVKTDFIDVNCSYILGTSTTKNDSVSYPAPYGNAKFGAKHQILVTLNDLNSIGIVDSGTINSIGFYVEKKKGTFLENFEIKIKNTSDSVLTDFVDETGMTSVFGPTLYKDFNGWNMHTFNQKHIWNGKTNLLLQICFNNEANSDNALIQFTKSTNNSVVFYAANDSLVCSKISGGSVSKNRPNLKFGYTGPPPTPNFTVDDTISCTGTFVFTDLTPDSKAWLWDFGDGKMSTEQHPVHTYSLAGTYSVSLQVANKYGNDTLTKVNYVNAATDQGASTPTCRPNTLNYCCGYGVNRFYLDGKDLLDINNYSSNGSEGYMDFSCSHIAEIYTDLENEFSLDINSDKAYFQDIWIWIDLNDNGQFDNSERIFQKDSANVSLQGFFSIPNDTALILNKLLRLRILTDATGALIDSCFEPQYGQVEDYGIIIRKVPSPVADFIIDTTFYNCGDSVIFSNFSKYDAERVWDFGDGYTSTEKNPVHFYEEEGVFTVTLTATNSSGYDLLIKPNVVTVNCVFNLPDTGSLTFTSCNGKVFDNGGTNDYTDNTDVTFTIAPLDADHVIINFISFDFETGADYLYVYDGIDTSSALLGKFDGNSLPNGGTITSTSPYLTLRQVTDNFAVKSGFEADWTCQRKPTAKFIFEYVDTCLQILQFYEQTNNVDEWLWLFGDSDSSTSPQPAHIFKNNTDYNVSLYVSNAYGSDTITKTVQNFSVNADFNMSLDTVDVAKAEQVFFTDKSSNASSWEWIFGDGNNSNKQNPLHQYYTIGQYSVYLLASNEICEDAASKKLVVVDRTGMLNGLSEGEFLSIYPNPSKDKFILEYRFLNNQHLKIEIKDALGRLIFEENKEADKIYKKEFILESYKGIYTLHITTNKKQIIRKIILQ